MLVGRITSSPPMSARSPHAHRQKPPMDVQAIIDLAGIPVVVRVLIDDMRATIGDVAGK
jgi:hypothetical protein